MRPDDLPSAAAAAEASDRAPLDAEPRRDPVRAPDGPLAAALQPGVWRLAWPAVLTNLLHSTVGFVDIKIVGALGAPAVAAVTTGNRLLFAFQAVLMAVGAGTTALVARAWGAGDRAEANRVTVASVVVCAASALVATVPAALFADEIARAFRLGDEAVAMAGVFMRWLACFFAPFSVMFMIGTALRAAGDTRTPLWIGAATAAVNIPLVYGLVGGHFGLPALGILGAALANGLSMCLSALLFAGLWLRGRLRLGWRSGRALEGHRLRRMLAIGYPAALEQVFWQGGFIGFLWIVSFYGTAPYAAYGIGVSILAFSFVVGFGFSIAAGTLVGQHLGAGDPEGAMRSGWRALLLSVCAMATLSACIMLGARSLARFMIDDPEVVDLTVFFMYVLGAVQPLMAVEFALGGALRGAGDTRFPLFAVLAGLVFVRIGLALLFVHLGLSVEWVFCALIADYVVKASLLTWRFASGRWKHLAVMQGAPGPA